MCGRRIFGTYSLHYVCLDEEGSGWRNHSEAGMESNHWVSECLGLIRLPPWCSVVAHPCHLGGAEGLASPSPVVV